MIQSPVPGGVNPEGSGAWKKRPGLTDHEIVSLINESWWSLLVSASLLHQDKRDDDGHAASVVYDAACLLNLCTDGSTRTPDKRIVLTAALLHDIGWSCLSASERSALFSPLLKSETELELRRKHERLGAGLARKLMVDSGCPPDIIQPVTAIIDGHDTAAGFRSIEDGLVRDADKLWMVTSEGFAADLRRRGVSADHWSGELEKRFNMEDELFCSSARRIAEKRLETLKSGTTEKEKRDEEQLPVQKPLVLIAHYRVGWTDGVSLEIEKRRVVLMEMGFEVLLVSGPGSRGADFIIDELDFESPEVKRIAMNMFGDLQDLSENELAEHVFKLSDAIEDKLSAVLLETEPDFIMTHNIFSHGRHVAAARAFCNVIKSYGAASLTTHHDFYWERDDFRKPSCRWAAEYLETYVPPEIPGMKHAVINSIAAGELEKRTGLIPMIFPDTLDFDVNPWVKDGYNSDFYDDFNLSGNDILILQATRIVRRKGIELVPPLIRRLGSTEIMKRFEGKKLYNGKQITRESRVVFLLAGYAEHEAEIYREELLQLMKDEGIEFRFLQPQIAAERGKLSDGRKIYSLFDTYPYADLVSYPSLYEGWGNQFIEAVFAHKPVVLFEYPVYRSDIKPLGYRVISMGKEASSAASGLYRLPELRVEQCTEEIADWLLSSETPENLKYNFQLARENNSYDYLRVLIKQSMEHYRGYENI